MAVIKSFFESELNLLAIILDVNEDAFLIRISERLMRIYVEDQDCVYLHCNRTNSEL